MLLWTPAFALGHAHISAGTDLSRASCPSPPACGGEGGTRRGVSRKPAGLIRGDGRVRWVAPLLGTAGIPHLTPDPLRPQGRRGGYFGHLPGCEICACPSAKAGIQSLPVA